LEDFNPEAAAPLKRVDYLGVVCDVLLLRRQLTPYYVLNLTDKSLPFTGVIETSNLTGREEFGNSSLLYLPRYRDQKSPMWDRSDEEVHRESIDGLRRIITDFSEKDIVAWQVNRARFVQPVHPVGWGEQLPPVRLANGLGYLSTAQIHPWPVFNDEVVRHVDEHLEEIDRLINAGK
jgi:protoporphyrinogen oxidase